MSREPSRERPILFSSAMVRALLAGTKTQTRRAVKPQPVESYSVLGDVRETRGWSWPMSDGQHLPCPGDAMLARCPYGEPGDRLWVKETFVDRSGDLFYRADEHAQAGYEVTFGESLKRWKPSIHMPRAASRITLEITGVRVERLQEISEADARAEGAPPGHPSIDRVSREFGFADFPRSWYGQMWEQINGRGSWAANPWVWVLEFRKLERQG